MHERIQSEPWISSNESAAPYPHHDPAYQASPDLCSKLLVLRLVFVIVLGCLAATPIGASAAPAQCRPDVLGTSRTLTIGDAGPFTLGLKTYPQTLALADHEVVLTFDDGPLPATTPRVLAALAQQCVRATFFLIGRNALAAPALVREEVADGHSLGSHTFSHPAITERGLPDAAAEADIDRGFAAVNEAAYGSHDPEPRVPFFRFPGFADTTALDRWLAGRHITVFSADLWASDWLPMTPADELKLLMTRLEKAGRGIILLHDIKKQTADMLPTLLDTLRREHFRVVHLEPGTGVTATATAPAGWRSETERTVTALWPRLVALGARSPMPH
jgi:peptidoglycan-N-acetylglucosamine deacetylase